MGVDLGQHVSVGIVPPVEGSVQRLQRRMLTGAHAVGRFEALETRWNGANIAARVLSGHLRGQLLLGVGAGGAAAQLSAATSPQRQRVVQPQAVLVGHVEGVRRLVQLLSGALGFSNVKNYGHIYKSQTFGKKTAKQITQTARITGDGADKVDARLVVRLHQNVISADDVNGHALRVLRRLARTAANVIGGGQRSGDVVDDELPEGHHHRSQLVVHHGDVGKENGGQLTGVGQLPTVVGDSRGTDAVGVVGGQQPPVTGKRLAPGFHSKGNVEMICQGI